MANFILLLIVLTAMCGLPKRCRVEYTREPGDHAIWDGDACEHPGQVVVGIMNSLGRVQLECTRLVAVCE